MKIINRPMSTSYVPEFAFHLIKDEEEANNIKKIIGDKKVVKVMQTLDQKTFTPMILFAIEDTNKPFAEWLKYVSPMTMAPLTNT